MKLLTDMFLDGKDSEPVGSQENILHDAAVAHALIEAVEYHLSDTQIRWVYRRADSTMESWGY